MSNSRKSFVPRTMASTRRAALSVFAWATEVVELESGWIAFEDEVEAALWRAQTKSVVHLRDSDSAVVHLRARA